jgi:phosphoadenosine phosphosulfate reductase
MVELRKEWKRAQLDLERSLGMRRRSNRWQKMRPLLLVVIVLSAATLVWSWSGRLRSLPPCADPRVVGLRGGSQREAPGPQGKNRPPEVSLRGLRKQGSIKMGHLDFLAEAEGVHDVASALDKLNKRFDDIPVLQQPVAMLKWASKTLPEGKWAQVTSFGLSGLTILDMAAKSGVLEKMPVITIDTLHLFPETYKLIEDVKDFYDTQQINSYRHKHTATLEEFNLKYGDKLFKGDPALYDFVTKIEPMKRALDELHAVAWITGRRKSQGGERVFLKLFEVDPADGRLKLNPVANWGREEIWKYIKDNRVPYNKLHDRGYTSIGDVHSTAKVVADEEGERAGRFKGENRSECGMHHAHTSETSEGLNKRAERIRAGYVWEQSAKLRAKNLGIMQLTEETVDNVLGKARTHVLLEIYAPWCPHCQHFEPQFNELVKRIHMSDRLSGDDKIQPVRMDGFENKLAGTWASKMPFQSFPTLYILIKTSGRGPGSMRAAKYEGKSHEPDDVLKWIEAQVSGAKVQQAELSAMMN